MLKERTRNQVKRNPQKEEREVCQYILAYLSENPDAGDTLEGIGEWWLRNQMIKFEMQIISRAVANLVAEGLIVERKGRDSHSIYKIRYTEENRRKISTRLSEIRRSLQN